MHAVLLTEVPPPLETWLDAAGLLGCVPLNIGTADDYRVPDRAYLATEPTTTFVPTAAVVVDIRSPRDETWEKLGWQTED